MKLDALIEWLKVPIYGDGKTVRDWLYVDFLEPDIEKKTSFEAKIFDITRGGMKVILEENGAMVFIPFSHISSSKEDLVLASDTGEALVKGNVVKRLGDKLKVRIVEVNKETRSIVGAPCEPFGGLILPDPATLKRGGNRANRS